MYIKETIAKPSFHAPRIHIQSHTLCPISQYTHRKQRPISHLMNPASEPAPVRRRVVTSSKVAVVLVIVPTSGSVVGLPTVQSSIGAAVVLATFCLLPAQDVVDSFSAALEGCRRGCVWGPAGSSSTARAKSSAALASRPVLTSRGLGLSIF